jgi:hypothetical protein
MKTLATPISDVRPTSPKGLTVRTGVRAGSTDSIADYLTRRHRR